MTQKNDYKNLIDNVSNFWTVGRNGQLDYLQLVFWDKSKMNEMKRILAVNHVVSLINENGIKVMFMGRTLSTAERELIRAVETKDYVKNNLLIKAFDHMGKVRA